MVLQRFFAKRNNGDPKQKWNFELNFLKNWRRYGKYLRVSRSCDLSQHEAVGFFCNGNNGGTDRWRFGWRSLWVFGKKKGLGKKDALRIGVVLYLVVFAKFWNGVVVGKRQERGTVWGRWKMGVCRSMAKLICQLTVLWTIWVRNEKVLRLLGK